MTVSNNFMASTLDLNGVVSLKQPTQLTWGVDGRLYVTELAGGVQVLTVAFGDKNPADGDNPIEGDYKEAGKTNGAIDTGNGSINGMAEYTSTILDGNGVKMSGALLAVSLNQGSLIIIGRDDDGLVQTSVSGGFTLAAKRTTFATGGGQPLGLDAIGDDYASMFLSQAFQGSVWIAKLGASQIQILQPNNGKVPLAGSPIADPTDQDGDGLNHFVDPFEFSGDNGWTSARRATASCSA